MDLRTIGDVRTSDVELHSLILWINLTNRSLSFYHISSMSSSTRRNLRFYCREPSASRFLCATSWNGPCCSKKLHRLTVSWFECALLFLLKSLCETLAKYGFWVRIVSLSSLRSCLMIVLRIFSKSFAVDVMLEQFCRMMPPSPLYKVEALVSD